jgi:hypothetical protein
VEYISQIHPLVPVDIITWFDDTLLAFIFHVMTKEGIQTVHAATVILGTAHKTTTAAHKTTSSL